MDSDWDLHAVVRGCYAAAASTTTTTSTAATATSTTLGYNPRNYSQQDWSSFSTTTTSFQDLFTPIRTEYYSPSELHDIYMPFYPKPEQQRNEAASKLKKELSPQSLPISPLSVLNGVPDLSCEQQQQQQQQKNNQTQHIMFKQFPLQRQHLLSVSNGSKASPRAKKRKNNLKKVCHVPVDKLSSDMWSWRKYGQKPIKGSPYPRGYYKCSTSKGCPARKQVERDRSDPDMYIVTYASEHNHPMPTHRSSLAGTTRNKQSGDENPDRTTTTASSLPEISSPATTSNNSSEKMDSHCQDELIEDEELSVSDVALDDDFFAGLEDLTGQECGSDGFVENMWPLEGNDLMDVVLK